ncbi:hypothetical protein QAD02_023044 [Eretmocerus hayati]|uniref:Uncharacterized protein n=1 Tax=Eretmocerus hayati TaxID=131215 RepID=A0ACC2PUI5_9HYME|nr:hypothetical protein QAD02_023044 [Eretmocerus hayati]
MEMNTEVPTDNFNGAMEGRIDKQFVGMDAKITNLQNQVNVLTTVTTNQRALTKDELVLGLDDLATKHKLVLPFKTKEKFEEFEEKPAGQLYQDLYVHNLFLYRMPYSHPDNSPFFLSTDALIHVYIPRILENGKKDDKIPEYKELKILQSAISKVINDLLDWEGRVRNASSAPKAIFPKKKRPQADSNDLENSNASPNPSPVEQAKVADSNRTQLGDIDGNFLTY